MKPLNLLAFLLGLSLAFLPFRSFAYKSYCVTPRQGGWVLTDLTVGVVYPDSPASYGYDYSNGVLLYASGGETHFDVDSACVGYSWCTSCTDQTDNPSAIIVGSIYPPEPPEPSTCSDGLLTEGETGIDCGGECSAECQSFCPAGESILYDSEDIAFCGVTAMADNVGNCPGDTVDAGGGLCVGGSFQDVILAATDPQLSVTFSLVPFETGAISYSTVSTPETVVDNGDGTETVTITNTTTNNINNTSTSTSVSVNRPSGSASGTGFSSSGGSGVGVASGYSGTSDIAGETAIEDNPGNYDFSGTSPTQNDYDSSFVLNPDEYPEHDIDGLMSDFIDNSNLVDSLGAMEISTSNPICSINVTLPANYGGTLSISLCRWEDKLEDIGVVFLAFVVGSSILIVIRGF